MAGRIGRARAAISIAWLAACVAWPSPGHAQGASAPGLEHEIAKQQSIYEGRGTQRIEGYVIDRSLAAYVGALAAAFEPSLLGLGAGERWLDVGAGEGQAILDYHAPPPGDDARAWPPRERKASTVAISIEDRRTARWHEVAARLESERIRYLHGRGLGQYSAAELGRFRIVSDVIGGFSYTTRPDRYMERVLQVLEPGGSLFTLLQDVRSERRENAPYYAGAPFLTQIKRPDGTDVTVCSWLKRIDCVAVTCELRADWKPPVEVYHVRKTCERVDVPRLTPVHYAAGTPPERRFVLEADPLPARGADR